MGVAEATGLHVFVFGLHKFQTPTEVGAVLMKISKHPRCPDTKRNRVAKICLLL